MVAMMMTATDNTPVDVLVVGAGPAGSTAARTAAEAGLHVLMVEKRPVVGLPVQCAEYVPAQILGHVDLPERCIAQRIRTLRTHLPDGHAVETPAAGYVLDRALFDQALCIAAIQAGAKLWTRTRAVERTGPSVLVRRVGELVEVTPRVLIGADGPRSTVGRWIGQTNPALLDAHQVEVVLPNPQDYTQVYFDPAYPGGYGWRFPKGATANVGVGVNPALGGDSKRALQHLLARLEVPPDTIIAHTAGPVPASGTIARLRVDNVLLAGDAAGHTHPITGAGILSAVISGQLAGQAATHAIQEGDTTVLDDYEREWNAFMGGPLRHALEKRRAMEAGWSDDPSALSDVLRETWIAFKTYGRRRQSRGIERSPSITKT